MVSYKFQFNTKSSAKLTLYGMLAFNKQLQICGFENVVKNAGLTLNVPSNVRPTYIATACKLTQAFCRMGTSNQQYGSESACVKFLTNQVPFGTYDQADQNSVVCRLAHLRYAAILPNVHCPHLGRSGGKACTKKSYQWYYNGTTDFLKCAYQFRN